MIPTLCALNCNYANNDNPKIFHAAPTSLPGYAPCPSPPSLDLEARNDWEVMVTAAHNSAVAATITGVDADAKDDVTVGAAHAPGSGTI